MYIRSDIIYVATESLVIPSDWLDQGVLLGWIASDLVSVVT